MPEGPWETHGHLRVSEDGRRLEHEDGEPFFWLGDTAWQMFAKLDAEEADRFLRDRAEKHFNVIQAQVVSWNVSMPNANGDLPFDHGDADRPNDRYWKHVDAIIARAGALGLYLVLLPAWGLGNAAATMVGQNLGAGLPERAEESAWKAGRYNLVFMGVVGVFTFIFARQITSMFSADPEVIAYGTSCLRILGIGYPAYALGMVMSQAINGAGDTMTPTTLNLIAFWLVQIPLAYWLAEGVQLGPNGVFTAIVVSESLLTVLAVIVFRRGHWKLVSA